MAGYQGRGTIFEFGDGTAGSGDTITGLTLSAGIGTVTATGHSIVVGDIVEITGVVGMTNVNDFHIVRTVPDANSFTFENGTASGTYTSDGTATPQNTTWTSIPGILSWGTTDDRSRVDVSALDTTGGRAEFVTGLSEGGWTASLNWQPNAAAHGFASGLLKLAQVGTPFWQRVSFPQVSTSPSPYVAYLGLLSTQAFNAEEKLGFEISGPVSRALLVSSGA